ncbi:Mitochondrial import inner membrane translocase subunit Tim21 [Chamberlinius hualienensis]
MSYLASMSRGFLANGLKVNNFGGIRYINHRYKSAASNNSKTVVKSNKETTEGQVAPFSEKVKQTTKDVYYSGIVIAGILITGGLGYTIFRELFSSESPNGVYSKAFKLCKSHYKLVDAVGEPMSGFGETTGRGRRRHVSHVQFEQDGVQCMRMRFYVKGSRQKGTAHLEVRKNEKGKYEFRYLFVELDNILRETIVIEDNR